MWCAGCIDRSSSTLELSCDVLAGRGNRSFAHALIKEPEISDLCCSVIDVWFGISFAFGEGLQKKQKGPEVFYAFPFYLWPRCAAQHTCLYVVVFVAE